MSVNGIKITDVAVYPLKNKTSKDGLTAFARINLNDQLVINGLRVIEGKKGVFVAFPQNYNREEKKGHDICFPITARLRSYVTDQILEQYASQMAEQ